MHSSCNLAGLDFGVRVWIDSRRKMVLYVWYEIANGRKGKEYGIRVVSMGWLIANQQVATKCELNQRFWVYIYLSHFYLLTTLHTNQRLSCLVPLSWKKREIYWATGIQDSDEWSARVDARARKLSLPKMNWKLSPRRFVKSYGWIVKATHRGRSRSRVWYTRRPLWKQKQFSK